MLYPVENQLLSQLVQSTANHTKCVSHPVVPNSAIPWVAVHPLPLSMGFSRQGYWSGLPFPSPRGLANLGIEPGSPALQANSLPTEL